MDKEIERKRKNNEYNKLKGKRRRREEWDNPLNHIYMDKLTPQEQERVKEFIIIAKLQNEGLGIRKIARELNKSHVTIIKKMKREYENKYLRYKYIKEIVSKGNY